MSPTNAAGPGPWDVPDSISEPAGRLLRTADVDQAVAAITENYQPGRLEIADARRPLDMVMWTNTLPNLRLNYLSYGTDVIVTAPPMERYVLCFPVTGRLRIGSARTQIEASANLLGTAISAGIPMFFEKWSDDCRVLTVRFAPVQLEELLTTMLDRPLTGPIRFDLRMDLADRAVQPLLRTLTLVRTELDRPGGIVSDPAMGAGLTRLVMTGLLLAQPHNYSALLRQPAKPAAPGQIRDAIEFMESHPTEIAGVADLARAARLSVRALEAGFRKHIGMPPMTYLRKIRMAGARSDLERADAAAATAASIARRWGFHHYGRFATAYRERYDEAPSDTLRK
ncbi:AraC family transcriptional regulator [Amycolatopsis sp. EV170708-02-1]|uniref:AraC family transcriptional regulator n=1 Tax=Amycolatopsis sp. EV170708-02-1 TaxID=2919322 RepID=UPI001F0BE2BC|nr:AraC family transcriptional regulator [Amycolatopsis sp. EV170708-02-1]UMP03415.1 AraC family transcriptional regulator [Amycolatopsis sp. EV170708-02-1]